MLPVKTIIAESINKKPAPDKKSKKESLKDEKKQTKTNKKNDIFDENGKLILPKKQNKEIEKSIVINQEIKINKQEKKRAYWRKYYHNNKQKYREWNKRWRDKQKAKKIQSKNGPSKKESE